MPPDPVALYNIVQYRSSLKGKGIPRRVAFQHHNSDHTHSNSKLSNLVDGPDSFWLWIKQSGHSKFGNTIQQISLSPERTLHDNLKAISPSEATTAHSTTSISDMATLHSRFAASTSRLRSRSTIPNDESPTNRGMVIEDIIRRHDDPNLNAHQHVISGGTITAIAVGVLVFVLCLVAGLLYCLNARGKRAAERRAIDLDKSRRHDFHGGGAIPVKKGSDASTIWSSPLAPDEMPPEIVVIERPQVNMTFQTTTKPSA